MSRKPENPQQAARDQGRAAQPPKQNPSDHRDFASREIQRGTQRSETQTEDGPRRNDAGSLDDGSRGGPEHGDDKRPYKRAGR